MQLVQAEMLHTIAEITPTTAISSMLQSNGLEYISTTVHSLTSPASNMFHQWLTLEEDAAAVIEDDPHGDDEEGPAEEELGSPKKLELLNQTLTHAHKIHNLGVRLGDSMFQSSALKMCEHVMKQSTSICTPHV